jgi:pre-peptidase
MARHTHFFRFLLSLGITCSSLLAQTTPPTVNFTSPAGMQRGTSGIFLIEGTGFENASEIVFSEPGLTGKILEVGEVPSWRLALDNVAAAPVKPYFEDPVKMQARVEIKADDWMAAGTHLFRLITPRGSSTPGRLVVSTFPEREEQEPNDALSSAQSLKLPVTINGIVLTAGDGDYYRFQAAAGQEVVLQINTTGSSLDPLLDLYDAKGKLVTSNRKERNRSVIGYRVAQDGWYTTRVSDQLQSGSLRHFYRLTVGEIPFIISRYPLGLKTGTKRPFQVRGFNLGTALTATPEPFGLVAGKVMDVGALSVSSEKGEAVNVLPIAIGRYDETDEEARNNSIETAMGLKVPVTVNARIGPDASGKTQADYYRFAARKGQRLILETTAARLGSPMDSLIEVLDAKGNLVPRLTARPVWKSQIILFDRDSKSPGLRIAQPQVLELDDYMVSGSDLMKVVKLTNGPDEDVIYDNFGGQRLGMEDTTPEAHALDDFIYKVELHPPGTAFAPNGMPLFQFYFRNDDGGSGYGKDSRVTFTAPADGTYYARVADVRNQSGDDFAYRFSLREPVPDFVVTASPINPNIPEGSKTPVEVSVLRQEGFAGPVEVEFDGLPGQLQATKGIIPAREKSVTLLLSLKPGARLPEKWVRYRIIGKARLGNEVVQRVANGGDLLKLIAVMPKPDIKVSVRQGKIRITPKGEAQVTLAVERFNGFKGRVQFRLQDLPYGVRPIDVGLNGVMIAENETERTFTLECRPFVQPETRAIYAIGIVEALVPTEHSSEPVLLQVEGTDAHRAAR